MDISTRSTSNGSPRATGTSTPSFLVSRPAFPKPGCSATSPSTSCQGRIQLWQASRYPASQEARLRRAAAEHHRANRVGQRIADVAVLLFLLTALGLTAWVGQREHQLTIRERQLLQQVKR